MDPQQSDAESRPATAGAIPLATPATKRAIGRGDWGTVAIGTHPISIRVLVTVAGTVVWLGAMLIATGAADLVREKAGKGSVRVEGHTDAKGSDSYNQNLSDRRAESVKKWFTSHGLQDMHFSTVGFGAKKPVASNTTSAGSDDPIGRAKNRRVEIVITK